MIIPPASRHAPVAASYCAHLPETLDLTTATRPAWTAYAAWVVSAVVVRGFIDRTGPETYVPLDHRYIEGHVPRKVRRRLMGDLLDAGVLECDGMYYFGDRAGKKAGRHVRGGPGKCLCYRLGAHHRMAKIQPHHITHTELLRKVNRFRQQERDAIKDPVHLALRAWHDRVEVLPDAPAGEHPLLDRLIDGERRFSVCPQGRVHTNVANLPRQYRQFIRLAGREVMSCDISTSQPLLLAVLLTEAHQKGGGPNRQAVCVPSSDTSLSDYLRDCLDGSVYDRLAGLTGYSRDDVKALFLAVVYGRPEHMDTKVGRAVRALYSGVFDAVTTLNYRLGSGGLPRLMQQQESRVMIGRVAARLLREAPDMPLLTVHDSVLVPAEFVPMVQTVIAEEWEAEFGVVPRLKVSSFTAPQEVRPQRKRRGRKFEADVSPGLAA